MMDIGNRLTIQFTDMQGHVIHQWCLFTQLLKIYWWYLVVLLLEISNNKIIITIFN